MNKMIHGKQDFMEKQKNIKKIIIIQIHFKIMVKINSIGKNNKKEVNNHVKFSMIMICQYKLLTYAITIREFRICEE